MLLFVSILLTKKEIYQFLVSWIGSKWYLTWLFFLEGKLKPYKYIKKTGGLVLGLWCSAHHLLHPKAFVVKIVKAVMEFPVLGTNQSKLLFDIIQKTEEKMWWTFAQPAFFQSQNQGSKYNHWIKSAINKQIDEIYF